MICRNNIITVNLGILIHNYNQVKASLSNKSSVMPVVKANAYGHGIVKVSQTLQKVGAPAFCVALTEEGMLLRDNGITKPILMLGAVMPDSVELSIKYNLTQTVCSVDNVKLVEKEAKIMNETAFVQLKIDTGMNRIGARSKEEITSIMHEIENSPHVEIKSVFTHFADCDAEPECSKINDFTKSQFKKFNELTKSLPANVVRDTANSAAILRYPESHLDAVRAGIVLYGYPPVKTDLDINPILSWTSEVVFVKNVLPGDSFGYNRTSIANKPMRVATVAVGYGDGYFRALSNKGKVLINGHFANILGRVCMDQIIVDVTDIPNVKICDKVVLIGKQGNNKIDANDLADWAGTISYEILLAPSIRVPKKYTY